MTIRSVAVALAEAAERVCAELLPNGKRVGHTWIVGDVTGAPGESLEVELEGEKAGLWVDHHGGGGGDMITLIMENKMISKGLAVRKGMEILGLKDDGERNGFFDPLKFPLPRDGGIFITGNAYWTYHTPTGQIDGYVVRFDFPDGKKDVIPIRIVDGKPKWKGWLKDQGKPLFNAHLILQRKEATVLVVEGEKTAVAAQKLFPEFVVTTCQGGAKAFPYGQWDILLNRKLILWPDNDTEGRKAMIYLKSRFPKATLVDTSGLPEKWDLADPLPEGVSPRGILDGARTAPKPAAPELIAAARPFRCLGFIDDSFYYLSYFSGCVVCLKAVEHTELSLQLISNDEYWMSEGFNQPKAIGVDWKRVAKFLISLQWQQGVYNPDNIRGLGCWIDGNSIVYHAGDHLIVDGQRVDIFKHPSKYIYPTRPPVEIDMSTIASVEELAPFLTMCGLLPWQNKGTGWMLAGLVFLAPICGVLRWRPAGWMLGPPGVGKTWTYREVITLLVGPSLNVLSSTTAAAVRQVLGCDALPVIFDEIEAKDQASIKRIVEILELIRQASAESGGAIYKGSPSGVARKFMTRSIFILSSVVFGATESADESRIARLEYKHRTDHGEFAQIKALAQKTSQNSKFAKAFVARAVTYAAKIREAAEIFTDAIRTASGDSRKGQQFGAIAAGFHYLTNDEPPDVAIVQAWAKTQDWENVGVPGGGDADHSRAIQILTQAKANLMDADGKNYSYNVGELLAIYYERTVRSGFAKDALQRIGIDPKHDSVDIAVRHTALSAIFRDTQFAERWSDYFRRVEGAESKNYVPRGGTCTRSTRLPKAVVCLLPQEDLPVTPPPPEPEPEPPVDPEPYFVS